MTVAIVLLLAIATQLLDVLVLWMLGQSLGLPTTLQQWFIIALTVLLVSMLPISIGGWGVHEGAMVVALHGFGVVPEDALCPPCCLAFVRSLPRCPPGCCG
jgi:hypothetical protein